MFKNILEFNKKFSTELKCEKFLIKKRFADGKVKCPYCKSHKNWKTNEGRYKCGECQVSFTIKVGTIFEGSKIGLRKWFMAIYFLTTSSKGISSLQLSKELSITQKTAWFMLQRLRHLTNFNFIILNKKQYVKSTTFFFNENEKGSAAYGIVLDLWGFIPYFCMSVGPFSISNSNWTDLHILFKRKNWFKPFGLLFFTN